MPDELYNNNQHGSAKEGCCQNSSSHTENRQKKTTRKNGERRLEKMKRKRDDSQGERNSKGSGTEGQWEGGWLTGTGIGVKEKPDPRSIEGVV